MIEYELNQRTRVKNEDGSNSFLLNKPTATQKPIVKKKTSADKEIAITTSILDRDDQLNLLATLVEQIGDAIALDTPEFLLAKAKFAEIKNVLQG